MGQAGRVEETGFNPRLSHTKTQKWYFIPSCLTLSLIRYISRVKRSNSG